MPVASKLRVAVVGGGPAGLMAADIVSAAGMRVTVYDRMPSLGRKLLMAGRGGLNLTHSEPLEAFMARYREQAPRLRPAIDAFPPTAVRAWCESLGQETFVGTSGRVFPRSMKTSPLLRAWLRRLADRGVEMRLRHTWRGWDETGRLTFDTPSGAALVATDAAVLALGGGSWPGLGSDGSWVELLRSAGIRIAPLAAANCGFQTDWSAHFKERFAGQPLKRIGLAHQGRSVRGEALITSEGLEGGAFYALSAELRNAIARDGSTKVLIDLWPDLERAALEARLSAPRGKSSLSTFLRKMHLSAVAVGLLQEWAHKQGKPLGALGPNAMAEYIKGVPVVLTGTAPMARAISTAGGIEMAELDAHFMLAQRPGMFVAGEMLDWEAPTGGYLLQACLATGAAAGRGVLAWLAIDKGAT